MRFAISVIRQSARALFIVFFFTLAINAQSTAFTYQGRLTDSLQPVNGAYEMQFRLFEAASGGNQIGSTITISNVQILNGVFAVQLDFGAGAFVSGNRFLEVSARPVGNPNPPLVLNPRHQITSTPFSIKSLNADNATNAQNAANAQNATNAQNAVNATNATNAMNATTATNALQLGGVAANQFVQTNDVRLSDARNPLPGSANYIQNTTNQQAASNFNISGNGVVGGTLSANAVNAATAYNIGGFRVLTVNSETSNTFVGLFNATNANATGFGDSFFGYQAGDVNTGNNNSFFGAFAGSNNTTASANSFFGSLAGSMNVTGSSNSFFGAAAGRRNATGRNNVFIGSETGDTNHVGSNNTIIGTNADVGADNLTNATAIGSNAVVTQNNSLVLGSINGVNFATADTNVGIGTTAPSASLHIKTNGGNILIGNALCNSGFAGIGFAQSFSNCANFSFLGNGTDTIINRPTGGSIFFREGNITQMSIAPTGTVSINKLGVAGAQPLCRNPTNNEISNCSSSLRYKTDIAPFRFGLNLVNRLQPITFRWKESGMLDLGLGAEEVAEVEPLLVTYNSEGEVEGVKYDRIGVVLLNAVREQQTQIARQQEQIKKQQDLIEGLRKLVCSDHPRAEVCR